MNRSRRLATWFGAGLIVVTGAPAAHAAAAGRTGDAASACGTSAGDFAGGFRDVEYPEVGYLFDPVNNLVTVFYRGSPIDQGTSQAGAGQITWTVEGTTYSSQSVHCGNPSKPSQVTGIAAATSDDSDQVLLGRF